MFKISEWSAHFREVLSVFRLFIIFLYQRIWKSVNYVYLLISKVLIIKYLFNNEKLLKYQYSKSNFSPTNFELCDVFITKITVS